MKAASTPLRIAGRFVLRALGVPIYRLAFFLKRQTGRVLMPAKNRVAYLASNRYAIHVSVVAIAAFASGTNLQGSEVRAESFGTGSMLYALVAQDDSQAVEVVSAQPAPPPSNVSYLDNDGTIASRAYPDLDLNSHAYATTTVGGSAVSAPTIYDGGASVAPRTAVETYQVAEGDTLYGIADRFGLSLSSLLWANNMTVRSIIRPGQSVKIPPIDGVIYTIKKGDSLSRIAKAYGAETERIIAFNRLSSADDLVVGEQIVLPDAEPPAPPRTASVARIFTTGKAPLTGQTSTRTGALAGFSGGSGTWVWPTNWHVITQYYGWKHTGVDIDGDYTTVSRAASDGVVIYSGWRNGYGYTIEVDHGNGLVTRYAHHSKNLVKVGQAVSVGETLAKTGSTGRSTGTHLHFEVIKNGKFQNPLDYVR
ncbi:M23 family metallopeptidase [Patescibacteria group bacterium]|nr:MAG: M23 family metallopeptidase [Patescibacteria group bacterium]